MKVANTYLTREAYFLDATEDLSTLRDTSCVDLFDQNGYHLTKAEQAFLSRNGYQKIARRHEDCLRQDWIQWDKKNGAHINHSDIFERKGFRDNALEQLDVFAVFHYEWDSFDYDELLVKKLEIEELVLRLDWDAVAIDIWDLKDEWFKLDFFDQTKWRTNYFGISPEKFKNVIWEGETL